ncbi:MAG: hypothetical protein WC516_09905 [Patescibacteria group bacterium]
MINFIDMIFDELTHEAFDRKVKIIDPANNPEPHPDTEHKTPPASEPANP